jgi:Co/Zn/Cd efflux system component
MRWQLLAFLTQFLSGVFIAFLTLLVLLELLKGLISNPKIHHSQVILILLLTALSSIWSILPGLFRKAIYRSIKDRQAGRT